jgi:hypothetical protein
MLNSHRIRHGTLALWRATGARKALLLAALTVALLPFSWASQPTHEIHIGAVASAYGATGAKPVVAKPTSDTVAVAEVMWDDSDWRAWEAQVQEIHAPPDIAAGEPLRVEVHAVDANGQPLSNARVEITWILPGRQYKDTCVTGFFGDASVTRTIGTACGGKRCVIAVTVTGDRGLACAYSAFKPK